jgi:hypothetical protein
MAYAYQQEYKQLSDNTAQADLTGKRFGEYRLRQAGYIIQGGEHNKRIQEAVKIPQEPAQEPSQSQDYGFGG